MEKDLKEHKESEFTSARFQDPLGVHMQEMSLVRKRHLEQFPPVDDAYRGFYAHFTPQDADGMRYLGGAWGVVGAELELAVFAGGLGFVAPDGKQVALLDEPLVARLEELRKQDWVIHCILAFTVYRAEDQSLTGEFACMCYHSQLAEKQKKALETFINNITKRIDSAFRPGLELTQEQFVKVIESEGTWFLTKEVPWPSLPKGSVFYRRRRTLNDRLIAAAVKGNKGCIIASWVGIVVIVLALLWAIWFFFFRGSVG
ncbi:MAG: NAD(P)-dependent oxidoreductase [Coriobacteriales bacterium]|nr:NAD(P)-dependent oxidoreductase [Coriobacteriales bacterium]